MNERIRELAEQAMVETQHEFGGKYLAFSKEKFAELIVRDIIDILDKEVDLAYEQEEAWTASTLQALSLEILEHFDMELSE